VAGPGAGDGVAGDGHEGDVAGVDEAGREHGVGRLRPDAVTDLRYRVEGDTELPFHERGGRLLVRGDAVVRLAAVLDPVPLPRDLRPHRRRGHLVVFADAGIEEVDVRPVGEPPPR